jgi:hypothetical protein
MRDMPANNSSDKRCNSTQPIPLLPFIPSIIIVVPIPIRRKKQLQELLSNVNYFTNYDAHSCNNVQMKQMITISTSFKAGNPTGPLYHTNVNSLLHIASLWYVSLITYNLMQQITATILNVLKNLQQNKYATR